MSQTHPPSPRRACGLALAAVFFVTLAASNYLAGIEPPLSALLTDSSSRPALPVRFAFATADFFMAAWWIFAAAAVAFICFSPRPAIERLHLHIITGGIVWMTVYLASTTLAWHGVHRLAYAIGGTG